MSGKFPYADLGLDISLEEVRQEAYSYLDEVYKNYAAQGFLPPNLNLNRGLARGLIELDSFGRHKVYKDFAALLPNCFPLYACGPWLDQHCAQIGLERKPALKAQGLISFSRTSGHGNIKIPAGRILRTKPDGLGEVYRFITTADAVINEKENQAAVPLVSEEYGRAVNVGPGMICEMVTKVPGVTAINKTGWLKVEGADEEDDDSLRRRYVLRWKGLSGLNKYAYESWAMGVAGVVSVKVADQHPRGQGTVDVIVKGTAGIPTESLLNQVAAAIEKQRPQNDDCLVLAPTPYPAVLDLTLEIYQGAHEQIKSEVENRLRAMFIEPETVKGVAPLKIGEDLTHSRIISECMKSAGIKRVIIHSPVADLAIPFNGLAVLESINIKSVSCEL